MTSTSISIFSTRSTKKKNKLQQTCVEDEAVWTKKKKTDSTNKSTQFYCAIEIYVPFQVNGRLLFFPPFEKKKIAAAANCHRLKLMIRQRSMNCVNLNEKILYIFCCWYFYFYCCCCNNMLLLFFITFHILLRRRKKKFIIYIPLEIESDYKIKSNRFG